MLLPVIGSLLTRINKVLSKAGLEFARYPVYFANLSFFARDGLLPAGEPETSYAPGLGRPQA